MPCHAMHPIQDLFLKVFHMYYNLICNFYMHSYVDKKFHSCKKWVLQAYTRMKIHSVEPRRHVKQTNHHTSCAIQNLINKASFELSSTDGNPCQDNGNKQPHKLHKIRSKAGDKDIHEGKAKDKIKYNQTRESVQSSRTVITKSQELPQFTRSEGSTRSSTTERGYIISHSDRSKSAVESELPRHAGISKACSASTFTFLDPFHGA
jgi:hypothetical protein